MDLAFELHDLVHTMDQQATTLLRPLGLTLRQHTALVVLDQHPGCQGRHLAAALGVTPAATTGVVKGLARAGWVVDEAPAGTGNRQQLCLTAEGAAMLRRSTAALGDPFDDVVRGCGHDPDALGAALRRITDRLRTDPKG